MDQSAPILVTIKRNLIETTIWNLIIKTITNNQQPQSITITTNIINININELNLTLQKTTTSKIKYNSSKIKNNSIKIKYNSIKRYIVGIKVQINELAYCLNLET